MRGFFSYAEDERRATVTGLNLFFSALLGANLGAMNDLPLRDYVQMILILAGTVTAILTLAVARRRIMIWSMAVTLVFILGTITLPGIGPDGLEDELDRLAITLGIWVVMLLSIRFTPSSDDTATTPVIREED